MKPLYAGLAHPRFGASWPGGRADRLPKGHDDQSLAMRHAGYTIGANKLGNFLEPTGQGDRERSGRRKHREHRAAYFAITATASTSISHSGRTSRFTTAKVLAGGFAVLTYLSRISRTVVICEGSTLSAQ
jgi:hypothetical protein